MPPLAVTRSGTGAPLVLLHGIGSSRRAWDPVLPALAARFDVIAVDLPGFGDSAPLDGQAEVPPARLAESVADLLDELGVTAPHLAGNPDRRLYEDTGQAAALSRWPRAR